MDLLETILKLSGVPIEGSPVENFFKRLEAISRDHPLDPKAFIVHDCSVHCQPSRGNQEVHINSMDSLTKGSGTVALKAICEIADELNVPLSLLAYGYADTPTKKLVEWYQRFGFVTGFGDAKNGFRMKRDPNPPIKLRGFTRPH
jgi:hypothetical protein